MGIVRPHMLVATCTSQLAIAWPAARSYASRRALSALISHTRSVVQKKCAEFFFILKVKSPKAKDQGVARYSKYNLVAKQSNTIVFPVEEESAFIRQLSVDAGGR